NSSRDDEALSLTQDGIWAVFASDRHDLAAKGGYDLYRVTVPERLRSAVEVLFTGSIEDGSVRRPLGVDATITIYAESGQRVETSDRYEKDPGVTERNNFAVRLYSGREYRVVVSAPGFHPQEFFLDYKGNVPAGKVDRRGIVLIPVKPGEDVSIPGETRLIVGIVLDDSTGLSLPGTRVEMAMRGRSPESVMLDRDAHFTIKAEDKWEFELSASAPGYVPQRRPFTATPDLKQIVIRMRPAGAADACPGDDPRCVDNTKVYFGVDSAALDAKEIPKIQAVVRIMKADPAMKVEIQGHTDGTATAEYNQKLSEQRAAAVQSALKAAGIAPDRMLVRGYGFGRRIVTPDQDPKSRALNRRVEFRRLVR
ncbi:MAG: OmpA family protein, partial [Spirochaetia bacterium]|nr:OmpA family protein [Spirochaetia bacterium]